ncbi:hypothetical protein NLI96_g11791 [Meripilus lineatus]|uniref:Uncharacterized protein n=1 Tax=Meripilus lineatus TaxID=2056292 RepID=A0AAD5Y855_9APHY|nr:hypothetical protein NLI96_g11791 [Physisporinus lineatus]
MCFNPYSKETQHPSQTTSTTPTRKRTQHLPSSEQVHQPQVSYALRQPLLQPSPQLQPQPSPLQQQQQQQQPQAQPQQQQQPQTQQLPQTSVSSTNTSSLTPAPTSTVGVKRKHPGDEDDQDNVLGGVSSRGASNIPKTVRKRRIRLSLGDPEGDTVLGVGVGVPDGMSLVGGVSDRGNTAGGAKHWTDDEKGKLFNWMLNSDEHWEMFATQMNTIFRDAAARLFDNKKSFTALKSCYHRNVETFKQIYAFEVFLAQYSTGVSSESADPHDIIHAPIPPSFPSSIHRQTFLERKLEAARTIGGIPVGNLNVKVIDHWYRMGWYSLFRKRYREDPQTGQLAPYHGPATFPSESQTAPLFPQPPPQSAYPAPTDIDPSLLPNGGASSSSLVGVGVNVHVGGVGVGGEEEDDEDEDAEHEQDPSHNPTQDLDPSSLSQDHHHHHHHTTGTDLTGLTQRQALNQDPTICIIPPPFPVTTSPMTSTGPSISHSHHQQQQRPVPLKLPSSESIRSHMSAGTSGAGPSQVMQPFSAFTMYTSPSEIPNVSPPSTSAFTKPLAPTTYTHAQHQPQHLQQQGNSLHPQIIDALTQFTTLTQTLITTCSSLTDFLRIQAEESNQRLDLLRKSQQSRGGEGDSRESMDKKEKANLATTVLSNPAVDEQVRQAAAEYLKRLFASD